MYLKGSFSWLLQCAYLSPDNCAFNGFSISTFRLSLSHSISLIHYLVRLEFKRSPVIAINYAVCKREYALLIDFGIINTLKVIFLKRMDGLTVLFCRTLCIHQIHTLHIHSCDVHFCGSGSTMLNEEHVLLMIKLKYTNQKKNEPESFEEEEKKHLVK